MLTRLEVDGFKNLVDFQLDFGPYTCIVGRNGVGKSNIFDAILFLSLLTENTINQSALQIRNSGEGVGDIADLFFSDSGKREHRIKFATEMIVDGSVSDDFGREVRPSSSFLRYEVSFRYEPPSESIGPLGGLVLEREELRPITKGNAARHLRFPHHRANFRDSVVYNNRHARSGFISTLKGEPTTIVVHQDGGSHGRGRPAPAQGATRTIIGTENTAATPTILAARQEMQNWRVLALEPSAMRKPDSYTQPPGIAANGAHIPATLKHLANIAERHGDLPGDIFAVVSNRLSDLVPVRTVSIEQDDMRQLLSLVLEESTGLELKATSISDGTLRFLALAVLAEVSDETGVFCMEEPENGIHPGNLPAMNELLHDIAVDVNNEVDADNPLRQVIVATHSPYFVQLQDKEELVLAKGVMKRTDAGEIIQHLECCAYTESWRARKGQCDGVDLVSLQTYLLPPDEAQLAFPVGFWSKDWE